MKKTENGNNWSALFREQFEKVKKEEKKPSLLLHACCAPCSSYVVEYLENYFDITLFFYNPNITSEEEYEHRLSELERLMKEMPLRRKIQVIDGGFDKDVFYRLAKGAEDAPERGERCYKCYRERISMTKNKADEEKFDYFSTTLSISPHKSADFINMIGSNLYNGKGSGWLYSDFKKNEGYKRSIELSKQYSLYRQNYCGCEYSKQS